MLAGKTKFPYTCSVPHEGIVKSLTRVFFDWKRFWGIRAVGDFLAAIFSAFTHEHPAREETSHIRECPKKQHGAWRTEKEGEFDLPCLKRGFAFTTTMLDGFIHPFRQPGVSVPSFRSFDVDRHGPIRLG